MYLKLIAISVMSLLTHVTAFGDLSVIQSQATIVLESSNSQKPYRELQKSEFKKILVQSKIFGVIPHNRDVGLLSLKIFSPIKTKIYLSWDNKNSMFPRSSNEISFRREGDYKSIYFNVIKPLSGFIYLKTRDNKLISKIYYNVKKQSKYSQSISLNVHEYETGFNNNDFQSSTLRYSIRQRNNNGKGRWSGNIGFSENSSNSKSASAGVTYSW